MQGSFQVGDTGDPGSVRLYCMFTFRVVDKQHIHILAMFLIQEAAF